MRRAVCTSMARGDAGTRLSPIALAPAASARSASSTQVMPQILKWTGMSPFHVAPSRAAQGGGGALESVLQHRRLVGAPKAVLVDLRKCEGDAVDTKIVDPSTEKWIGR